MSGRISGAVSLAHVKAVLFDLDGTLLDSAPDLGAAANQMRTHRGLEALPLVDYRALVGSGARGMIQAAFGLTPESNEFEALKDEFFANYQRRLTQQSTLFDGVEPLVAAIVKSGLTWGVVTNKSARFTTPLTQAMAFFADAGTIISGDTTPHAKPHPAPLLLAAQELGVKPAECVYVGDDERDIVAGKAAGMLTVAAAYGYLCHGVDHRDWRADFTIDHPLDLARHLNCC